MINTKVDIKAISGNLRELRMALGKSAEQQGRELAGSCCYVAARLSRPQEAGGTNRGARLGTAVGKKQEANIYAAISAYAIRVSPDNKNVESVPSLVENHTGRVRAGRKIQSAKRIARFGDNRKARSTDANFETLRRTIIKRAGWNKSAWVKGMIFVNPESRQRAPQYITRHLGSVPVSVSVSNGGNSWNATITNLTDGSGDAFDENAYSVAARAAEAGQAMRYEAQLKKAIKEAKVA